MNLPQTYKPSDDKKIADSIFKTSVQGLYYIAHSTYKDDRGFFSEVARFPELEAVIGHEFKVKQINHPRSYDNVVRGIHAENWNKYITVTNGLCFSAVVDVRPESATFGNKEYFVLGIGENVLDGSIYIPARTGNSMCVLQGPVDYLYFVDAVYKERDTTGDVAISLFDSDIDIQWPIPREQMIISERDMKAITLREKYPEKFNK
jgi:dTDP-4-dehydrorhamnose 3,5-epimerase